MANDNCVQIHWGILQNHVFLFITFALILVLFSILRPITPVNLKQPMLKETFMEISESHWENMFYP